jgi:succinate-acetate transporter protein
MSDYDFVQHLSILSVNLADHFHKPSIYMFDPFEKSEKNHPRIRIGNPGALTLHPIKQTGGSDMAGSFSDPGIAIMVKDMTANPAPLGLLGFGLTTVLLNLHNAGFFAMGSMILGMGIFYGGLAQVIAGIMEWKKNNLFGMVAFTSYGLFWLSLVALLVLPRLGLADSPSNVAMTAYLAMWGIFTAVMFIGTLRMSKALQFIFS